MTEPDPPAPAVEGPPIGPRSEEWDARYEEGTPHWDVGGPSPPLLHFLERGELPSSGTVLVPGCGSGHELPVLARAGHAPVGLDFAPRAVEAARARLEEAGESGRVLEADVLDPGIALEPDSVDWVFEQTCFCALPPDRRGDYVRTLARLVRPGGEVWALHMRTAYSERPPYDSDPDEVVALYAAAGFELVEHRALEDVSLERRKGRESLLRFRRVATP